MPLPGFPLSNTPIPKILTNTPCIVCAKMLINAGVNEIVFSGNYPDDLAKNMLDDSNIKLRNFNNKNIKYFNKKNPTRFEKIRKI